MGIHLVTQALNYCAQAAENMQALDTVMTQDKENAKAIVASAMECVELMLKAEKFILPNWGKIFDEDEMEVCNDIVIPVRLPYPMVAIEYFCDYDDPKCEPMLEGELRSTKRVALCVETEALNEHTSFLAHINDDLNGDAEGFWVFPVCYSDGLKVWTPPPSGYFFPRTGKMKIGSMKNHGELSLMPLGFDTYSFFPENERLMRAQRDASDEAFSLIHLLAALNIDKGRCEILPAPHKLNKKRAKKNRVPLHEYKILDIVADVMQAEKPANKPHQGGTHASPRMHKRRGHVRRLRSGRATWVRDAIIGKPGTGAVEKEYSVHE